MKKCFKNPFILILLKNNIVLDGQQKVVRARGKNWNNFLLTILERSSIKFPLIIDTPVKGMDRLQNEEQQIYFRTRSQFLCFVIDSDKQDFTDKFHEITMEK